MSINFDIVAQCDFAIIVITELVGEDKFPKS
jgi:hypothetical protein